MTFKIGDEVRIRKDSKYCTGYGLNPINCTGKVISTDCAGDYKYRVEWGNSSSNRYRDCDLELATPRQEEPEYKPFGELSDEEKAKLFLAWCNGEKIEVVSLKGTNWGITDNPVWVKHACYRIKPKPPTKPSINWDHVHPDYKCLYVDESGVGYISTVIPELVDNSCVDLGLSWSYRGVTQFAQPFTSFEPGTCDWRDSLVQRPE